MLAVFNVLGSMLMLFSITYVLPMITSVIYRDGLFVDFIYAAVAEELGFAGSLAVLAGFALLIGVGFGIALRSRDRFRKLTAAGLTWVLGLQAFLIIGGVLRLVPLTGITLPFTRRDRR